MIWKHYHAQRLHSTAFDGSANGHYGNACMSRDIAVSNSLPTLNRSPIGGPHYGQGSLRPTPVCRALALLVFKHSLHERRRIGDDGTRRARRVNIWGRC